MFLVTFLRVFCCLGDKRLKFHQTKSDDEVIKALKSNQGLLW